MKKFNDLSIEEQAKAAKYLKVAIFHETFRAATVSLVNLQHTINPRTMKHYNNLIELLEIEHGWSEAYPFLSYWSPYENNLISIVLNNLMKEHGCVNFRKTREKVISDNAFNAIMLSILQSCCDKNLYFGEQNDKYVSFENLNWGAHIVDDDMKNLSKERK